MSAAYTHHLRIIATQGINLVKAGVVAGENISSLFSRTLYSLATSLALRIHLFLLPTSLNLQS